MKNYVEKDVGNYGGNYVVSYPDFRRHVGSYVPNFMLSNFVSDVVSNVVSRVVTYVRIFYTYYITYYLFIAPLLKIRFSVPAKRDETAIFNPKGETLKVGLQTTLSSRFTGTENQILITVAMINIIHYSKQNTANFNYSSIL